MQQQERRTTWEQYVDSWKVASDADKRALYAQALSPECVYTDPLTQARGHDELVAYMLEFHKQIPGGHFVTMEFASHHDRSIAHWEMRDGEHKTVGTGVSYGEYGADGKLTAMTGFFEVPASASFRTDP